MRSRMGRIEDKLDEILELLRPKKRGRKPQNKVKKAGEWVIRYLRGKKGVMLREGVTLPDHADLPHVIMMHGKEAGFNRPTLRMARLELEGRIDVLHVKGSKKWMWRLRE